MKTSRETVVMSKWIKEIDEIDHEFACKTIIYNYGLHKVFSIYENSERFRVVYLNTEKPAQNFFHDINQLKKFGSDYNSKRSHTDVTQYWYKSNSDEKVNMQGFLNLIFQHDFTLREIKSEIFEQIGLTDPEIEIMNAIYALVKENKINEAINQAIKVQHDGYFEVIWNLTVHYQKQFFEPDTIITLKHLFSLYQAIHKLNPHFAEASERLMEIYLGQEAETYEETQQYKKTAFELALKSENKKMKDRIFDTFCGGKGMNPLIKNVSVDLDTLYACAETIRQQKEEINTLKMKLEVENNRSQKEVGIKRKTLFWEDQASGKKTKYTEDESKDIDHSQKINNQYSLNSTK